jgi:glycosyltransferase involved in cell wall biosynthesis
VSEPVAVDAPALPRYPGQPVGHRPRLVHLTTTDMSLALLLGPQLRAFAAAGYEVIGVSAPGPHVAELRSWGIHHVALKHATRAMALQRDARALAELVRVFRELEPRIVHTHNPKPGVYGRIAARIAGVPIVVNTVHGLYALPDDPIGKRAVVYSLERIAAACSQAELLQNPEDLPVLRRLRVPASRLTVLGNGIDLTRFTAGQVTPERVTALRAEMGAGPDDVVIGLVGRLVHEKGYREVFEAARRVAVRAPKARFAIIGPSDPDKADAITAAEIAAAEGIGNITFLGMRHDVEDLYAAMDAYVLASYREGFPRSAMEAAAMGVPIIATNIRGCRQVVEPGVTGMLVPARDAGALTDAITAMALDPKRRREMGEAARHKAKAEFDQQRVIDTTLATYRALEARRGRA